MLNSRGNVNKADIHLAPNQTGTLALVLGAPGKGNGNIYPAVVTCGALGSNMRIISAMANVTYVNSQQFQGCTMNSDGTASCSP